MFITGRNNPKNNGHFCCLIYFYSFRTENKLKSHSKYVKTKIYGIIMSSKKHNILRFKQYMQSNEMP